MCDYCNANLISCVILSFYTFTFSTLHLFPKYPVVQRNLSHYICSHKYPSNSAYSLSLIIPRYSSWQIYHLPSQPC